MQHWGEFSLMTETVGSIVIRKPKKFIVGTNVDTRKTIHQKHNGVKHLTKRTSRNENYNLDEEQIIAVNRHDNNMIFPATEVGIFF